MQGVGGSGPVWLCKFDKQGNRTGCYESEEPGDICEAQLLHTEVLLPHGEVWTLAIIRWEVPDKCISDIKKKLSRVAPGAGFDQWAYMLLAYMHGRCVCLGNNNNILFYPFQNIQGRKCYCASVICKVICCIKLLFYCQLFLARNLLNSLFISLLFLLLRTHRAWHQAHACSITCTYTTVEDGVFISLACELGLVLSWNNGITCSHVTWLFLPFFIRCWSKTPLDNRHFSLCLMLSPLQLIACHFHVQTDTRPSFMDRFRITFRSVGISIGCLLTFWAQSTCITTKNLGAL